jgi:hypothetical protein
MAMTKKEQEEMALLREARDMARAMRWPEYPCPARMTAAEINAAKVPGGVKHGSQQMVARGWFFWGTRVTYGCSDGIHHAVEGDVTTSQNAGRMFRTKLDALRAMRIERTIEVARELARIDAMIEAES